MTAAGGVNDKRVDDVAERRRFRSASLTPWPQFPDGDRGASGQARRAAQRLQVPGLRGPRQAWPGGAYDRFVRGRGRQLHAHPCETDTRFHSAYSQRLESLVVLVDAFDNEIAELTDFIGHLFRERRAIQQVPGIGPIIAAIFVAEIVTCTASTRRASGVVVRAHPRHRGSDATVRRGSITKKGSMLIRWAAIEAA